MKKESSVYRVSTQEKGISRLITSQYFIGLNVTFKILITRTFMGKNLMTFLELHTAELLDVPRNKYFQRKPSDIKIHNPSLYVS